ncbi:hypothetical protein NLG97_g1355 [Lecanicillium saksenae]|uniref:Uncharacterized protein n=1 Tax=Lecanicillium saksenae TaxID=468837 RepID=A0ACC1R6N0_9HYPO|nr:hypothetical protein NLG97_g1355 [Lecanicillium saksenae]
MNLSKVFVTILLTLTTSSKSLVLGADSKAQSLVNIIQHARTVIHDESVLMESTANGMTKYSPAAANDSAIQAIRGSLEHVIVAVQNTTNGAATLHVETRATDASSYAGAAPTFIEEFTAIGSDLSKIFAILLSVVNNSSLLQALAGDLINGLLEFIQVFGTILRAVPGIQTILNALGKLVGGIPT